MKKHQTNLLRIITFGTVLMFGLMFGGSLAGCVTSVPIKSVRTPTIDTNNIQRLAIMPFENRSGVGGTLGAQLTQYLTDRTRALITSSGRFTIVAPTDPSADGVFTGEIWGIISNHSRERTVRKDEEGNTHIDITHKRDVSVTFSYSVISSRTDMPIGTVNRYGSANDWNKRFSAVSSALTLAEWIVDSQLRSFQQDIIPSIVSTNQRLMKETSKDKGIKQMMKSVQDMVKSGNYEAAIRQYDEIGREYGSAAARTNADILRASIASNIAANAQLAQLYNNTNGLADRAVKDAVNALYSKLPPGAAIMIIKTEDAGYNMFDYVADQITKTVVQEERLKVVDRSNQMLIDAEQQFQLSGNVSDDSMVSIGRQLGVQYMVLCWISGEKSLRRLNVKVLNIETAQITDQKDFEI